MSDQLSLEELNAVVLGILDALATVLSPQVMTIVSERANAAITDRGGDGTSS